MSAPAPGFDDLFAREYARLVRALAIGCGDAEMAADAVQDAFVQAHRHWRRVAAYDDPAAWVRRVAINRLANQRRGRRRLDAALPRLWQPDEVEAPRAASEVARVVAELPPRQRLAVCLHYVADLSVADVAAALGVTEGTVKSQLHDARAALRTRLEVRDADR
jgi:RNA polymerase sigma-70 factor, ECF subfamily